MSSQSRMYVGGQSGAVVLAERAGRWEQRRTILKGRNVQALRVPNESGLMYAKLEDGVYASGDGGHSWDRVFEKGEYTLYTLDVDPSSPETVYVGLEPVALYRSRDAGDSWEEIASLRCQPEAVREKWWFPVYPHQAHVKYLHVDPRDSQRIFVALEHGGILRTDDGGKTWEDLCDGFENLDLHYVLTHPTRRDVVYAGSARGIYRSDDFGRDWVRTEDGSSYEDTGGLAIGVGARTTFYMAASRGTPPSWARPTGADSCVFRSEDDGQTWKPLSGLPGHAKSEYNGLTVDPLDPDRVYVHSGTKVWCSADRGDTWTVVYEAENAARLLCVAAGS